MSAAQIIKKHEENEKAASECVCARVRKQFSSRQFSFLTALILYTRKREGERERENVPERFTECCDTTCVLEKCACVPTGSFMEMRGDVLRSLNWPVAVCAVFSA